jgi:uncharacterized protein (TIGR00299 family) protein
MKARIPMSDKTLYLECYSGISGDMTVAALLDLGADQTVLVEGLKSLHVDGYKIEIGRREKNSIDVCDFDVILEEEPHIHNEHTHENAHFHSHENEPMHSHDHGHSHDHNHDHDHDHDYINKNNHDHSSTYERDNQGSQTNPNSSDLISNPNKIEHDTQEHPHAPIHIGHHDHRNLSIINDIIESSSISDKAKAIAKRIFYIVAAAEAKAHGKSIDEVHFHEVGAIDSIVDIVAAAICLDNLNIKDVVISELYEGTGFITCQHGILPIPVPAVINIASEHRLPLHITAVKGELVTPTGAAIAAAIRTNDSLPKEMKILKVGLGAGKRIYTGASSILRAMLIEDLSTTKASTITDKVWVLEANIDDCSGEALALAMELLLKNGAKDAYYTPIFMKKNRPAYMLGVICAEDKIEQLEDIIFTHTTTIGIRKTEAARSILNREALTVVTPYGEAIVKICTYKDKRFIYPEYESIRKMSELSGKDYMTLYHMVQSLVK